MRPLLLLLVIVAAGAAVFAWMRADRAEDRARDAEARAKAAVARAEAAEARAAGPPSQGVLLSADEVGELKRAGLTDPVNQLRSDLGAQGSLIPVPGVLGGKMGFYDRDGVVLLPGHYVYAPAEDGHIMVHAVLRYDVERGGKIRWKLLDAKRE